MLELDPASSLQILQERTDLSDGNFYSNTRQARLSQDREVEEIFAMFEGVIRILWANQCEKYFVIAGDLDKLNAAFGESWHGIRKIFEARDTDELSVVANILSHFQILAATGTNPLFTKTLISSMVLDPADVPEDKIQILQEPLVLEGATNTLGDWLKSVLGPQQVSLTTHPANYLSLTMPTLIVWCDSDKVIPLKEGEYLQSLMPNAELVVMKGVNHIPYLEDLDALMKIVMEFLGEVSP